MRTPKHTSFTCRVFTCLKEADDFLTLRQLSTRSGVSTTRASAALHHLFNRKAVNCLAEDNTLYWYATPDEDDRSRTYDERTDKEVHRSRKSKISHPRRKPNELPKRK